MGGIGIVNNPRSRRNRRHPGVAARLRQRLGGDGEVLDASTPEELDRAVERFRAADVEVLGVNGGDGTGHCVLTAFARAYGDRPLPRLLLLRGGAMNTVAHGHHIHGGPESILREVLIRRRHGLPLRVAERDLLRIEADGGAPRYGFIFGTGVVVTFLEAYYASPSPSPLTAALLLSRAIGSALAGGRFAAALTRREPLRVTTDGDEWPDASYLSVLAGATPDIGFGFKVFNRCAEQPGSFHVVGITAAPLQLAFALRRIHAGSPWRRRLAQDEVARELVLEGARPRFTIDGDLYGAERRIRVSTGPAIEIVLP
ncbi:diacylglycerol/lipid kinase family protein [Anaeromyxobacter oryzisoli]|jgi:diacylglycerol kinase (ATP)|uniref:diacylglycerol/lipid kinase family protein n=1 Tax=Anaeromyxobacter oryzisoli TaxID=2925408 RepID=UPI001F593571|nr:diacylglycerol kinase family protein [Anaeromyxobacter sp. SG63]